MPAGELGHLGHRLDAIRGGSPEPSGEALLRGLEAVGVPGVAGRRLQGAVELPADTTSAPPPMSANTFSVARFELAFIAKQTRWGMPENA